MSATSDPNYRPDIDGLRAIAVLGVVAFHAGLGPPGGFAGVDVFFVISGFLITNLIVREHEAGRFNLLEFWTRRVRRIVPALAVVAAFVLLAGLVFMPPSQLRHLGGPARALGLVWSNFFFARGRGYFDPGHEIDPLLHTWSLAVEEQFYIIFPPLLILCLGRFTRPAAIRVVGACWAISLLTGWAGSVGWPSINFFLPFGRAWELLVGSLLALCGTSASVSRTWRETVGLLGLTLVPLAFLIDSEGSGYPGLRALVPTLGTAMLIWAGGAGRWSGSTLLSSAPARGIGLISYSLYLWHWPILVLLRIAWQDEPSPQATALALTFVTVISYLSWRWIEMPCRRSARLHAPPAALLIWGVFSLGLVVAGTALRRGDGWVRRPWIQPIVSAEGHAWEVPTRLCYSDKANPLSLSDLPAIGCTGTACDVTPDFVVWGDSHAAAIADAVDEAATRAGACGRAAIRLGIAPMTDTWRLASGRSAIPWNDAVLRCIEEGRPRHVLLIARWSGTVDDGTQASSENLLMERSANHPNRSAVRAVARDALSRTVHRLAASGATCWILAEVPDQELTPTQVLTRRWLGLLGAWSDQVTTRSQHESRTANARSMLLELEQLPGVRMVDLGAVCLAEGLGAPAGGPEGSYYIDRNHLNAAGAKQLLSQPLEEIFRSIVRGRAPCESSTSKADPPAESGPN